MGSFKKFLSKAASYVVGGPLVGAAYESIDTERSRRHDLQLNQARTAAEQWQATHSVNPQTGALSGPPGLVPHSIALDVQAQHEQGVWRQQQMLGRQATGYGEGALGLLQSFRPGGGAALASGAYQGLSQTALQRAAMLEPMDLLADYRRDAEFQARKDAKKAATLQAITGIAGSLIQAGGMAIGGAAGGGGIAQAASNVLSTGINAAAGLAAQKSQMGARGAAESAGGGLQSMQGPAAPQAAPQAPQAAPAPQQQGPPAPQQQGGGGYQTGGGFGGGQAQPQFLQQAPPPGTPGPQGGGGMQEGAGVGYGGTGGFGRPHPGQMGSFGPMGYAMSASMDPSPMGQAVSMQLGQLLSFYVDADPDWGWLDEAVSNQIALRRYA